MGRKQSDAEPGRYATLILLLIGVVSCTLVYTLVTVAFGPGWGNSSSGSPKLTEGIGSGDNAEGEFGVESGECCRGIDNLELWGPAVKWGSDFKFNSPVECCKACKAMCGGNDGPCLCDTWVYCGNKEACGSKFGECWLKKQKDSLAPDRQEAGQTVIWTSGLVYGKGEGIIGLETEYGTMHIKLYPDCAPHSVSYILELLALRHCAGCQFHRAESRGQFWDLRGNHIPNAPYGPPFALIQGTLEAQGTPFRKSPKEACPTIKRGTVAWVGSGPEFFISLAKHEEWKREYTAFGSVLPEDMSIVERIAQLPTKSEVWNNVNVSVLEKPVPLALRRIKMSSKDVRVTS